MSKRKPIKKKVVNKKVVNKPSIKKPKQGHSKIQSLLFSRPTFTKPKATRWAKEQGFRVYKIDTTDSYHRLRQFNPNKNAKKRTITLTPGVKAIVEFK